MVETGQHLMCFCPLQGHSDPWLCYCWPIVSTTVTRTMASSGKWAGNLAYQAWGRGVGCYCYEAGGALALGGEAGLCCLQVTLTRALASLRGTGEAELLTQGERGCLRPHSKADYLLIVSFIYGWQKAHSQGLLLTVKYNCIFSKSEVEGQVGLHHPSWVCV
jgi:hypothetical protein